MAKINEYVGKAGQHIQSLKDNIQKYRGWLDEARGYFEERLEEMVKLTESQKKKKQKGIKGDKSTRQLEFFRNCAENLAKIDGSLTHNIYVFRQCVSSEVPENGGDQEPRGRDPEGRGLRRTPQKTRGKLFGVLQQQKGRRAEHPLRRKVPAARAAPQPRTRRTGTARQGRKLSAYRPPQNGRLTRTPSTK